METSGWLRVVVEQIQDDLTELKTDVKILLEERAEKRGKIYVMTGLITLAINLGAILFQAYMGR